MTCLGDQFGHAAGEKLKCFGTVVHAQTEDVGSRNTANEVRRYNHVVTLIACHVTSCKGIIKGLRRKLRGKIQTVLH